MGLSTRLANTSFVLQRRGDLCQQLGAEVGVDTPTFANWLACAFGNFHGARIALTAQGAAAGIDGGDVVALHEGKCSVASQGTICAQPCMSLPLPPKLPDCACRMSVPWTMPKHAMP
jgi:hypothetical protein